MTTGEQPDRLGTIGQALDHHGTVGALAAALPEAFSWTDQQAWQQVVAEELAANLARVGLALVPLAGGALLLDLEGQVDQHLREQAAVSWFGEGR